MIIRLKSNEYYDFYDVKRVKLINDDKIVIHGNFGKGKRYGDVEVFTEMLELKSFRDLVSYCKNYMKEFTYVGCCPHCESVRIMKYEKKLTHGFLNEPKPKIFIDQNDILGLQCVTCGKDFLKDDLKYVNIVLYYK